MAVSSNGPDTDFGYVCALTLTSAGEMTLGQGGKKLWPRHNVNRQMDGRVISTYPQPLFLGRVYNQHTLSLLSSRI